MVSEKLQHRIWTVRVDSSGLPAEASYEDTGHNISCPPPHGRANDEAAIFTAYYNHDQVDWWRAGDAAAANITGHNRAPNRGMAMATDDAVAADSLVAVLGDTTVIGMTPNAADITLASVADARGTSADQLAGMAQSCRSPADFKVVNAPAGLAVLGTSPGMAPTVTGGVPGTAANPLIPPVILHFNTSTWVAFVRQGAMNAELNIWVPAGTGLEPTPDTLVTPVAPMALGRVSTGAASQAFAVLVPQGNGALLVHTFPSNAMASWAVATPNALGGVAAVRFPGENTDTFIMGDAAGLLHAWRDGAERTNGNWPVNLGGDPITQTPLIEDLDSDGVMDVLVVLDTGSSTNKLAVVALGPSSGASVRTWAQFAQDSGNRGCLDATNRTN